MINFGKVLYWVFVIFLVYLIFELIRKVLGGSLGFEELVIISSFVIGYSSFLIRQIRNKRFILGDTSFLPRNRQLDLIYVLKTLLLKGGNL